MPLCSVPSYPRYQPQPTCHNRQTSRLTPYKTKTYASYCAVKTKTYASYCATKTYASNCTIATYSAVKTKTISSSCAVKKKTIASCRASRPRRSPGKGEEKTATSAQLTVLSVLP